MQNLIVTLIQSSLHWEEPARNLEMFTEKIEGIAESTDLIVLPEMFTTGFSMKPELVAEPMGGQGLQGFKKLQVRANAWFAEAFLLKKMVNITIVFFG